MLYRYYKLNLIMLLVSRERRDRFLNSLYPRFVKYLKGLIWLFLRMGRLVQVKLIQCLVVIGKPWSLKIWILKDRIRFLKIYQQIRTLLVWSPEQFISYSMKSKSTNKPNQNSEYTAHFYKSTTKKSTIYSKISPNLKHWIYINLN